MKMTMEMCRKALRERFAKQDEIIAQGLDGWLWESPWLTADRQHIPAHDSQQEVGNVANAPDGSGDWRAVKFYRAGVFIIGGWIPEKK